MESPEAGRLSPRRVALGWLLTVLGLPLLTALLSQAARGSSRIALATMLFLSLAVLVALVGGRWPALVAAVAGALLLNYFFIPPLHTLDVASTSDLVRAGRLRAHRGRRRRGRRRGGPAPSAGPGRRGRGRHPRDAQPPGPRRRVRRPAAARAGPRHLRRRLRRPGHRRAGRGHRGRRPAGRAGGLAGAPGRDARPTRTLGRCRLRLPRRASSASARSWPGRAWPRASSRPATVPGPLCSLRSPTTCGRRWPGCARPPRRCASTTTGSAPRSGTSCSTRWRSPSPG